MFSTRNTCRKSINQMLSNYLEIHKDLIKETDRGGFKVILPQIPIPFNIPPRLAKHGDLIFTYRYFCINTN